MFHAALTCDASEVRRLIDQGVDPNASNSQGFTALHFAAEVQCPSVISLLAHGGAVIDPRDNWGNTPLWRAVFRSRGEGAAVAVLLALGADPDAPNNEGVTPRGLAQSLAASCLAPFFPEAHAQG